MVSMRNKKIIPQIASNTPSYLELLNSVDHDQTAPFCPSTYNFYGNLYRLCLNRLLSDNIIVDKLLIVR